MRLERAAETASQSGEIGKDRGRLHQRHAVDEQHRGLAETAGLAKIRRPLAPRKGEIDRAVLVRQAKQGERKLGLIGMAGLAIAIEDERGHHALSWNSSRPISMRRISLVPAPISYSLASRS